MSSISRSPVTWQDYADLWGNDPRYSEQFKVIEPTLKAMGLTPSDLKDETGSQAGAANPSPSAFDAVNVDMIGGDAGQGAGQGGGSGAANAFSSTADFGAANSLSAGSGSGYGYGSGYGGADSSSFSSDSRVGPGFPPQAEPYRDMIESASRATGVPASLLAGLIHDESRWNPHAGTVNAGNGAGDTGLVQLNDGTFQELQAKHPELIGRDKNDPATNILAGALYLADMKELMKQRYGIDSWEIALRAYNSGPNGVDPYNLYSLPARTGTWNYVDKVMAHWQTIEAGGILPL